MKLVIATAAAVAMAALGTSAFAEGSKAPSVTGYVNLGYSYVDMSPAKLHTLVGRLGARFGKYVGAEGEGGFGLGTDRVVQGGFTIDSKFKSHFAGYGVVYLPLSPQAEVIRNPVECSPCFLRECPIDFRCMTGVSVERVVSAAAKKLEVRAGFES